MSLEQFFNSFRYQRDNFLKGFIQNRLPAFVTPDLLVAIRFALAALMCLLVYFRVDHLVLSLFLCWLVAEFVDLFDGPIARIRQKGTSYGKIIDGLSDLAVLLILAYGTLITFPLLTAIKWGIYIIIFLIIIAFIRSLSRPFFNFWQPYDDLIGIGFRAIISLIVLIQYLIFYSSAPAIPAQLECSDYSLAECPVQCQACASCPLCENLSCQDPEFCQNLK